MWLGRANKSVQERLLQIHDGMRLGMEAEANISRKAGNQTRPKQNILAGLLLTPSAVQLRNCAKKKKNW